MGTGMKGTGPLQQRRGRPIQWRPGRSVLPARGCLVGAQGDRLAAAREARPAGARAAGGHAGRPSCSGAVVHLAAAWEARSVARGRLVGAQGGCSGAVGPSCRRGTAGGGSARPSCGGAGAVQRGSGRTSYGRGSHSGGGEARPATTRDLGPACCGILRAEGKIG
jgi:hypothetical protein